VIEDIIMPIPVSRKLILDIMASHEMDIMIAVNVLGYENDPERFIEWFDPRTGAGEVKLPRYSSDIAAAFKVLAKMEETGYSWEGSNIGPPSDPLYEWEFRKGEKYGHAQEPTNSLAICKAALLATL
jgi:hypothetical protein